MTEIEHIVDQIERSYRGGAWHGPSVLEALEGVNAELAAGKLCPELHSIWEITVHLRVTIDILLGRIAGKLGFVDEAGHWRSIDEFSQVAWDDARQLLEARHESLVETIRCFDTSRLDQPLISGGSPAFNNFFGQAQHNAYHAGQIMVMKRLLAES